MPITTMRVQMVAQAQRPRAPMQRMADVVAGYFVVGVVAIALLTFFTWGLFGPQPSWVYGLINAVAVLIIACPCALGLATPMSVMVWTGAVLVAVVAAGNHSSLPRQIAARRPSSDRAVPTACSSASTPVVTGARIARNASQYTHAARATAAAYRGIETPAGNSQSSGSAASGGTRIRWHMPEWLRDAAGALLQTRSPLMKISAPANNNTKSQLSDNHVMSVSS